MVEGPLMRRALRSGFLFAAILILARRAGAEVAEPSGRADEAFDFMNLLNHHGLHDLKDEDWNAYGAVTDMWTQKLGFSAKYTDLHGSPNSLSPKPELSFAELATLYLGARLWPGAEAYIVPEIIGEKAFGETPIGQLKGLGGAIQNFELQKNGSTIPTPYLSRAYLVQTIGLGGGAIEKTSDPLQIARIDRRRRLVLRLGNFSILDFFDK